MADNRISQDIAAIENVVRARDCSGVRKLIRAFLRRSRNRIEARLLVADWYRRMGWFREAYVLVKLDRWSNSLTSTSTPRGAQQLWCARLINLLGGTEVAVSMLERIEPTKIQDHRIFGGIYLAGADYPKALGHFRRAAEMDRKKDSYAGKLAQLAEADCLAYLGKPLEAIKLASLIEVHSPNEGILSGMIAQALGEYCCLNSDWPEAMIHLNRALSLFPEDESPDRGFLEKWLGYAQGRLGDLSAARDSFARSLKILKRPGIRAETWLHTFYLMDQLGLLSEADRVRLRIYPGLNPTFIPLAGEPGSIAVGDGQEWWISEARDEFRYQGKYAIGLSQLERLLSILARVGAHGIGMTRLATLLWPDDFGSFTQFDQRLHLLFNRLRKIYRFRPIIEEREVRLSTDDLSRIQIEFSPARLPKTFFESRSEFSALEFRNHYGLGKTQSSLFIQEALARAEIRIKTGTNGPRVRYETIR